MLTLIKNYLRPRLWDELRALGNSRALQFTIFVPVLGYYILFGQWFNSAMTMPFECEFNLTRAYLLYYSFWMLAIASVLFAIACPSTVKKYPDKYDFSTKESHEFSKARKIWMRQEVAKAKYRRSATRQRWPRYSKVLKMRRSNSDSLHTEALGAFEDFLSATDGLSGKELAYQYYDWARRMNSLARGAATYL